MKKYLLVDDNDFSLSLTEDLVRQASESTDIDFVLVNDSKEAVRIFEASKPKEFSAIFMDVIMPEKTGIMILREIRSMERNDAKSVPIVIMSALSEDSGIIGAGERELITDYVQKPLSAEKISNALKKNRRRNFI